LHCDDVQCVKTERSVFPRPDRDILRSTYRRTYSDGRICSRDYRKWGSPYTFRDFKKRLKTWSWVSSFSHRSKTLRTSSAWVLRFLVLCNPCPSLRGTGFPASSGNEPVLCRHRSELRQKGLGTGFDCRFVGLALGGTGLLRGESYSPDIGRVVSDG